MEWKKLLGLLLAGGLAITACKEPEDCTPGTGDEDKDGFADCADAECANVAICNPPVEEDCNVVGDEDGDGFADCADTDCAADPDCLCGNGTIEAGEDCDGANLNGDDCTTIGDIFVGGNLACNADCSFNTANCTAPGQEDCTNGVDDNANGLVDCADTADCAANPVCIETGNCGDGVDNDLNGDIDCADAACAADPLCVVNNCGNGAIDAGETCDGALFGGATCASETGNAQPAGALACDATCQIDTTGCTAVLCSNDGVIDAGEQCDDGAGGVSNGSGDGCDDCVFTPDFEQEPNNDQAGANDFFVIDVEDDGIIKGNVFPVDDVDFFSFTIGTASVVTVETLDGPLGSNCAANEVDTEVDIFSAAGVSLDNDDDGGDGFCSLATAVVPAGDFAVQVRASDLVGVIDTFDYTVQVTITPIVCGDGIISSGEICDDGNFAAGDGCAADCLTVEAGFACAGEPSVCNAITCGDGLVQTGELCDDGNTATGDGCDDLCAVEVNFSCSGEPSVCQPVIPGTEPNDDTIPNQNGGNGNDFHNGFCDNTTTPCNVANGAQNCVVGTDGILTTTCTAHNDATLVTANFFNISGGNVLISEALSPAGDEDTFGIVNDTANLVQITAETFGPGGVGTCNIDTEINFRNAAGAELANDDEGGINSCSLETFAIAPGETLFVHVIDFLDNTLVPLYFLQISFTDVICNDGVIQAGVETCEDGNTTDGDGCSSLCLQEPGFLCDNTTLPSVCTATCGNGVVDAAAGEQCDDINGTPADGDGCSASCLVEAGFFCSGAPSVCVVVVDETEPNDDTIPNQNGGNGNDFHNGFCDNTTTPCNVANGAQNCVVGTDGILTTTCTAHNDDAQVIASGDPNNGNSPFGTSNGAVVISAALSPAGDEDTFAVTNDGVNLIKLTAETFGPGGAGTCVGVDTELNIRNAAGAELANDDDGGVANCSLETFAIAPGETLFVHVIEFGDNNIVPLYFLQISFQDIVCGDGVLEAGIETCEDGNTSDGDGCSSLCTIEGGFLCDNTTLPSVCTPSCGDGIVNSTDQCDGAALNGQDCVSQGFASGTLVCDAVCSFDFGGCVASVCGNGIIETGEVCDDANTNSGDGCDGAVCTVEQGFICAGEPSVCAVGDFEIEPNNTAAEATDFDAIDISPTDGNVLGSIGVVGDLDFYSFAIPTLSDVKIEVFDGTGAPNCAGGIDPDLQFIDQDATTVLVSDDLDGPNNCPKIDAVTDANARNRQPGDYFVRVNEFGNNDTIAAYTLVITLTPIVCGDSVLANGEGCDDGNANAGDGCSDLCTVEAGFNCDNTTLPSICTFVCGDSILNAGEQCDDGNLNTGDGCDGTCLVEIGFACDNTTLPSVCALSCGNGIVGDGAGEQCDDGNLTDGDGCDSLCLIEGLVQEVELNDSAADADASGLTISDSILIGGSITEGVDEKDFYRVDIAAVSVVRFETFTSAFECAAGTTTTLRLFQADGTTQIATDSTSGIRSCSALILALNPGTYYIQVEESGLNANVPFYLLEASFLTDQGVETEAAGTIGVNDTSATAESLVDGLSDVFTTGDHPTNDVDFYAITLPPGVGIRMEVIEATNISALADLTCNDFTIDADLHLIDSDGTTELIADDLDGRGFCPLIDGTGIAPLDAAAKNNTAADKIFFISVDGFDNTDVFGYRLVVTLR